MGPKRSIATAATLLAMLAAGSMAPAQEMRAQQAKLKSATAASNAADARARQLEAAAANERDRATKARAQEAAAAERIKAAEADIAAAEARIAIVDRLLASQRSQVAERQGPIVRLIAALQSMARRPAVLGLIQPGSTQDMVHVRAVLGTTLPVVERRTTEIRAELARVQQLRVNADTAVQSLRDGRTRLEAERIALVQLEATHRARSQALGRSALVESDRALAMGERARDIVDQMQSQEEANQVQRALLDLPGPLPRPDSASPSPPAARPAAYRLPVAGQLVTGLGELSATGVRARGLTLATTVNARVVAPAGGRVVYAGPFRGYGGVVIVDHGEGWTTLVAGLGGIAVRVGNQVAQGGVLGRAWREGEPRVTIELRRRGQPVDLAQLLN
ncbi:peptidoglycan DD-metalloendopeptidase family protein [Sphingomonas sp. HF-S4]|uniref:Peptidoglycan DD-metalloendopeptidase family protein n=1 Tax=Sphingomonas agrestis TaxID=3080540 RepID=A0ABU3Y9Q4_9SPHN|nr:peptidoglycan DD-metalloendopeptidase family protein [Sphingomonas sp. HF-S4]MDV3458143.1 peptidoglycan DD-metalloendopeptidase family protein [Sphingomonas sp. HF-S4]